MAKGISEQELVALLVKNGYDPTSIKAGLVNGHISKGVTTPTTTQEKLTELAYTSLSWAWFLAKVEFFWWLFKVCFRFLIVAVGLFFIWLAASNAPYCIWGIDGFPAGCIQHGQHIPLIKPWPYGGNSNG
jgi:hypothetical protein